MVSNRSYFIVALIGIIFFGCENKDVPLSADIPLFDCGTSTLLISGVRTTNATSCNLIDGSVSVSVSGGTAPYSYNINGGKFQVSNQFKNLGPGVYIITARDANLCPRNVTADLYATEEASGVTTTLDATVTVSPDTDCLDGNGEFTVTVTGGTPPYQYQYGSDPFTSSGFHQANLRVGFYSVTVRDAQSCPKLVGILVPRGSTGTSYATQIKPIVDKSCAIPGCHNGDNGATRNWTDFSLFQKNAQNIKTRTQNRSMPLTGSLTDDEIALIACWVDDGANNN